MHELQRTIQARIDDVIAALGEAERSAEGARAWPCGCSAIERLGNDLLCDWQMCGVHEHFAPTMQIGGG